MSDYCELSDGDTKLLHSTCMTLLFSDFSSCCCFFSYSINTIAHFSGTAFVRALNLWAGSPQSIQKAGHELLLAHSCNVTFCIAVRFIRVASQLSSLSTSENGLTHLNRQAMVRCISWEGCLFEKSNMETSVAKE